MRSGKRCHYCGETTIRSHNGQQGPSTATLDHLIPLSLGGSPGIGNVVVACGWCNRWKGHMLHAEWVTWLACIDLTKRDRTFRRKACLVLERWWKIALKDALDIEGAVDA